MEIPTDPILEFEEAIHDVNMFMGQRSRSVFEKYPLLFSLLGTFGIVCVLYGFEAILDEFPIMKEKPLIPLMVGVLVLVITGSLYKRLQRKADEA
jgi:hypothetical protein